MVKRGRILAYMPLTPLGDSNTAVERGLVHTIDRSGSPIDCVRINFACKECYEDNLVSLVRLRSQSLKCVWCSWRSNATDCSLPRLIQLATRAIEVGVSKAAFDASLRQHNDVLFLEHPELPTTSAERRGNHPVRLARLAAVALPDNAPTLHILDAVRLRSWQLQAFVWPETLTADTAPSARGEQLRAPTKTKSQSTDLRIGSHHPNNGPVVSSSSRSSPMDIYDFPDSDSTRTHTRIAAPITTSTHTASHSKRADLPSTSANSVRSGTSKWQAIAESDRQSSISRAQFCLPESSSDNLTSTSTISMSSASRSSGGPRGASTGHEGTAKAREALFAQTNNSPRADTAAAARTRDSASSSRVSPSTRPFATLSGQKRHELDARDLWNAEMGRAKIARIASPQRSLTKSRTGVENNGSSEFSTPARYADDPTLRHTSPSGPTTTPWLTPSFRQPLMTLQVRSRLAKHNMFTPVVASTGREVPIPRFADSLMAEQVSSVAPVDPANHEAAPTKSAAQSTVQHQIQTPAHTPSQTPQTQAIYIDDDDDNDHDDLILMPTPPRSAFAATSKIARRKRNLAQLAAWRGGKSTG